MDKTNNTELNELIWQVIASIPKGKVLTYGQVASLAGYPNHARYVGTTLKKLPKHSRLPWFRVINAKGELSFPIDSEKYKTQKHLLEKEGVLFIKGKVSLKQYSSYW